MKIAMIRLGKMGANTTRRLINNGHEVVVYDLDHDNVSHLVAEGAEGALSLEDLVSRLPVPRNVADGTGRRRGGKKRDGPSRIVRTG